MAIVIAIAVGLPLFFFFFFFGFPLLFFCACVCLLGQNKKYEHTKQHHFSRQVQCLSVVDAAVSPNFSICSSLNQQNIESRCDRHSIQSVDGRIVAQPWRERKGVEVGWSCTFKAYVQYCDCCIYFVLQLYCVVVDCGYFSWLIAPKFMSSRKGPLNRSNRQTLPEICSIDARSACGPTKQTKTKQNKKKKQKTDFSIVAKIPSK